MLADFLSPTDGRWNNQLLRGHLGMTFTIFQSTSRFAPSAKGAIPVSFYAREGPQFALIPLLQRPFPSSLGAPLSWSDAGSPSGYSSALFTDGPGWAFRALSAFLKACAERQIISVFVRLHPLLPLAAALDSTGRRVWHGETVYVDLTVPEQVLRHQQRSGHKHDICRLQSQGFKVVVDDWSLYDPFIQIYWEAMRRVNAAPFYLLSADYFRDLRQVLGSRMHLFSVLAPNCSIAAAALFTEVEGIVEYHLSGTVQEYRHLAPTKLMLDSAINWAKAAGNRVLHLGGGVGARHDALFQFKTGFSNLRSQFETWRVICDQKRYDELTQAAGLSDAPIDGFFPRLPSSVRNSLRPNETHPTLRSPHGSGVEQTYVRQAFASNWLSTVGPNITAFEKEFEDRIGRPAVALSSGTAAIHLGLKLLGVQDGDEVFCPMLTFVATANPIRYLGAKPGFSR